MRGGGMTMRERMMRERTRSKKRLWGERVDVQNEEEIKRQRGDSSGGGGDVDVEQNGGVKVVKSRKRRGEIAHGQATECNKRQRGQVAEVDGIRRSKRLAERAGDGTEYDTEHAHQRKRHEGVSKAVCDTVEPWRDK